MARKKKFKKLDRANGQYLYHDACIFCDSSDGMAVYEMEDGTHSSTCFVCNKFAIEYDVVNKCLVNPFNSNSKSSNLEEEEMTDIAGLSLGDMTTFDADNLKSRGLKKETLEAFGVKVGYDELGKIDTHFYPVTKDGVLTGYKTRSTFKEGDKEVAKKPALLGVMKNFKGKVGEVSGDVDMFGQMQFAPKADSKFPTKIVITEGEIDAMTVYQLISNFQKTAVPVVSVPSGANVKSIKHNLEYISKFKEIYLCADNDEAGKKLIDDACKVLPVGKLRIIKLPSNVKDPNQMIERTHPDKQQKAEKVFKEAFYGAEAYTPVGIVSLADCWDSFKARGTEAVIAFPESFGEINNMMRGGFAQGEITFIAAPTSAGKTTALYETIYDVAFRQDTKIGGIMLESDKGESLEKIMGIHMNKNLSLLNPEDKNWEELRKVYEDVSSNSNVVLVDHHGSMDSDDIIDKIEFLANGLDCKVVMLDPIQLAMSGASNDEMEDFMSDLLKVTKRTNVAVIVVSHVRKSSGGSKDISEGGRVTESDLKGSSALIQVAFNTIILERDKVNTDPIIRNTTRITIWKCRRTGQTGEAGTYEYVPETGRLKKGLSEAELAERYERAESGTCDPELDDFEFDNDSVEDFSATKKGSGTVKGMTKHDTHKPATAPIAELKVGDILDDDGNVIPKEVIEKIDSEVHMTGVEIDGELHEIVDKTKEKTTEEVLKEVEDMDMSFADFDSTFEDESDPDCPPW